MIDKRSFAAMRDIKVGEELTVDYAMIDNEPYEFLCTCGFIACRHVVTGFDWHRPELQERYAGYFAPYLAAKM